LATEAGIKGITDESCPSKQRLILDGKLWMAWDFLDFCQARGAFSYEQLHKILCLDVKKVLKI
jgi:hypothetical protein